MEYNQFMEALKGKQKKLDKNHNGELDKQDFEILRKEETEELDEIHRMKTKLNKLDPFSNRAVARQKLSNLMKSGKAKGALIANKMRTLNMGDDVDQEDLDALHEVLSKDAKAGDWISDFVHSDNPKFAGKTKKERIKMALGAYYGKQNEGYGSYRGYQSSSGPSHGHPYGGSGFGRREREDDEGYDNEPQHYKPVAPVPDKKYIKGTPENKAHKAANKPINGHPTNEEVEEIEERNKENALMRKTMDASRGARYKLNNPVPAAEPEHKTAQAHNKAIGRALRSEDKMTTTKDKDGKLVSFKYEGDWKKSTEKKQGSGKAANLAGQAMQKMAKANEEVEQIEENVYDGADQANSIKKALVAKHKDNNYNVRVNQKGQHVIDHAYFGTKKVKSQIKALSEAKEDPAEYDQEGDMAKTQLRSIKYHADELHEMLGDNDNLPEWVQSKLTLAQDYLQTVCDYMYSKDEVNEAVYAGLEKEDKPGKVKTAVVKLHPKGVGSDTVEGWKDPQKPVKEAVQKVDIPAYLRKAKGDTPLKMDDLKRKDTLSDAENLKRNRGVKESFDDEGNLIPTKISYKDFITEIKLADLPSRRIQGHSYGANYSDPEGADDYDDKKPMKPAAEKRGRGRPAGAKSGARKITGTSKLMNK